MKTRTCFFLIVAFGLLALPILKWKDSQPSDNTPYIPPTDRVPVLVSGPADPKSTPQLDTAPPGGDRVIQENRLEVIKGLADMLAAPISFHGKVVDQYGHPVPFADVRYSLLDKFMASGSGGGTQADAFGSIRISGIRGAVLGVNVSKEGYYQIHRVSNQRFGYGTGPDESLKPPPLPEDPAVFVLHKAGPTEALIFVENRSFRISKDGTPVRVDLNTGFVSEAGQLMVEAWTHERAPGGTRFYDWKCRISAPGGGLIERMGRFDFEAPSDGYKTFYEITMSKDNTLWTSDVEKSLFIKLADGCFGRVQFRMLAGGSHFFRMESYLNPNPGSRNLEYDPAKRIQPRP